MRERERQRARGKGRGRERLRESTRVCTFCHSIHVEVRTSLGRQFSPSTKDSGNRHSSLGLCRKDHDLLNRIVALNCVHVCKFDFFFLRQSLSCDPTIAEILPPISSGYNCRPGPPPPPPALSVFILKKLQPVDIFQKK